MVSYKKKNLKIRARCQFIYISFNMMRPYLQVWGIFSHHCVGFRYPSDGCRLYRQVGRMQSDVVSWLSDVDGYVHISAEGEITLKNQHN